MSRFKHGQRIRHNDKLYRFLNENRRTRVHALHQGGGNVLVLTGPEQNRDVLTNEQVHLMLDVLDTARLKNPCWNLKIADDGSFYTLELEAGNGHGKTRAFLADSFGNPERVCARSQTSRQQLEITVEDLKTRMQTTGEAPDNLLRQLKAHYPR